MFVTNSARGPFKVVSKHRVAVLAFDMTGHGARQDEGPANFYRRHPTASRLG